MRPLPNVPEELSPNRYIEKVSLTSGEVLDDDIHPKQLLVSNHRDYHPADIQARRFMSRLMRQTGSERRVLKKMKEVRELGHKTAEVVGKALGTDPEKVSRTLFGLERKEYYFRYRKPPYSREEIERRVEELQQRSAERLGRVTEGGHPRLRLLLTGGTGFVGKEILWQAAHDDSIAEVVVLIRPKEIRDRKSGEVVRTLTPAERGEDLLHQLWLTAPEERAKFRFVAGDVERPGLGVEPEVLEELRRRVTHVVHCAASVAFDDPYEKSFRANVTGTLNALRFSRDLQEAEGSPFVAHLGIETSYIHGRQVRQVAREDEILFPRNFYNNYYELTKAMASIETERVMLERGLRVVQLCPAIVIGEYRTGNNRGDTKVVNAPINLFGRAEEAIHGHEGKWTERSKTAMLARMACIFPGDPSAELNLIPVDWVASGILSALTRPQAVGRRIHLATDNRITSAQMGEVISEELGARITLAEPTFHRTVTLPVLSRLLSGLKQDRLANVLEKLGTIFGGYSEWGQPVHEVGNDARLLGLPSDRPNTLHAFRMLCRHNRFVQDYGKVKDAGEISRREKIWRRFVHELEERTGEPAGSLPAKDFRSALEAAIDLDSFEWKDPERKTLR